MFFLSCGVESNPPKAKPPVPEDIVKEAWDKYDAGDFLTSYSLFDSAITLDAYYKEAYFGKAWAATQLAKLDEAISSYSFAIILYSMKYDFERFDAPVFNEILPESDTLSWGIDSIIEGKIAIWHVNVKKPPLLCYSSVKIKKGTKYLEPEYHDIDYLRIFFKDSLYPDVTDTLEDTIFINYYSLVSPQPQDTVPENVYLSYIGLIGSYVAKEDYFSAIIAGNVLRLLADTALKFSHYPYTDYTKSKALLAYAAFKTNLMGLCVQVLIELDPQWTPPADPYSPDAKSYILEKINQYLGG